MSDDKDPQRISDAADNCDVLRARLAKYEDADGNPLAALKPPSAGVDERAALRDVVTDALMGMIAAVTSSTPPANEPPPPFIQSAIDRAVDRISSLNSSRAQLAAPAGVCAEWAKLDPAFVVMFLRQSSAFDADLIGEMLSYAISAAAPPPAPASEDDYIPAEIVGGIMRSESVDAVSMAAGALKPAPASDVVQVQTFCAYCGGNDEEPQEHCTDCSQPVAVPRHLLDDLHDLASDAAEHHRAAYASHKPTRQASIDSTVEAARALLNGGRV